MKIDYNAIVAQETPEMVCIYYYGRSGSYFFQTLLDNHPQVMMLPFDTMNAFYRIDNYPEQYWNQFFEKSGHDWDALVEEILDVGNTRVAFDGRLNPTLGLDCLGQNSDEVLIVDTEVFKTHFKNLIHEYGEVNRRNCFLAVHYAYCLAQGEDAALKRTIVFQMHTMLKDGFAAIRKDFKRVKGFVLVREVRATFSSAVQHTYKFAEKKSYKNYFGIYNRQFELFSELEDFIDHDVLRAIKLEDLHMFPRGTIGRMAQWLKIDYDPILLKSTCQGKTWWGDRNTPKVTGFSKHIINTKWKENLHPIDSFFMEKSFRLYEIFYNYPLYYQHLPKVFESILLYICIFIPTKYELELLFGYFAELKSGKVAFKKRTKRKFNEFVEEVHHIQQSNQREINNSILKKIPLWLAKKIRFLYNFLSLWSFFLYLRKIVINFKIVRRRSQLKLIECI